MTTASSVFAYVWLVIILTRITPNVVDLWEAILTFLFFPLLVITAYLTDKGCFRHGKQKSTGAEDDEHPEKPEGNAETGFCKRFIFSTEFLAIPAIFVASRYFVP